MLPSTYVVDCSWGEWTDYGACSEECGGGNQTRVRVKTLELCNGTPCTGEDIEIQSCNMDCCPGKVISIWKVITSVNLTHVQILPSSYIVDCSWGEWTDYGACSEECGGGNQTRVRVKTLDSCGGEPCHDDDLDVMIIDCNSDPCPGKMINLTLINEMHVPKSVLNE